MAEINKDDLFADDLSAPLEELSGSIGATISEMEKMRSTGKRLEDSMAKSNATVDESVADNKKLADALAKNELLEKKLADAIKKKDAEQKKSNAGTKEAIDGLGELAPAQAGAVKGFMAMVNAAKAFIATPVGAVIAALAIAIGSLTSFFRGSEAGQNRWNRIMAVAGEILEKLTDYVEVLGEAIFDKLGAAFTWLGSIAEKVFPNASLLVKSMVNDIVAEADRISDLREKFNTQERALIEERARVDKEASRLRNEAMALEGQAKLNLVNQAIALESKLMKQELEFAKTKREIAEKDAADDPTIENKKALAEATAALFTVEKNYYDSTKKFNAERIKLEEELGTQLEANRRAEVLARTEDIKYNELKIKDILPTQAAVVKGKIDETAATLTAAEAAKIKADQDALIVDKEKEKLIVTAEYGKTLGTLAGIMKKGTVAQKALSVAQALINTFVGATQVIRDEKLPTLAKFPAVLAIIALGLKQVASINGVGGFFKGTDNAPEGLAFVGERGAELIQTPSGQLALSPNRATLAYLEKGTKVYPHEKTMEMLGAGAEVTPGSMDKMLVSVFARTGDKIVEAIENNNIKVLAQGAVLYGLTERSNGNKRMIRLKSFSS